MPPLRKTRANTRLLHRKTSVLPAECSVVAWPIDRSTKRHLAPGHSFNGRTINLSHAGLRLHADLEVDAKSILDVELHLDRPSRRLRLRTQVAWTKRNATPLYGRWSMGLKILEAKEADLEVLRAYHQSLA